MNVCILLLTINYFFVLSFCVVGGAMAPASNPGGVTAAGPLLTTDRQTSRSVVITHPAGKGIIVFVNIMC